MSAVFDRCLTAQAERRPDHAALIDDGVAVSYRQLDERTNALAGRLTAANVRPGDRVVLVADNSIGHLIAALAVWRAGASLITIYPSSTVAELAHAIASTEPTMVIAGSRVVGTARTATAGGTVVVELADSGELGGLPGGDARSATHHELDPAALALVCFTSGSTSRPKAVMHTHGGLLGAAISYARVWHLGADDTTLVTLPLAWAFGLVTASMATLSAGGRVTIARRADPDDLLRRMVEHRVTFFPAVTTVFAKLVDSLERQGGRPDLSSLRLCISGGEPRNEAAFARWQTMSGCPVHDVYAASECFPVVTYDPVQDPQPRPGAAGRVVADAELRVVAEDGRDVAGHDVGEALTRGPATTIGYWGDPELTRSTLTPDGWYRTGDLVRVDELGYVHVVGRLTDMIIRGGANVSPAEVEAVLVAGDDVLEAAVVGIPHPDYGQEVVAAVVACSGRDVAQHSLLERCARQLAGYKLPSRIEFVDRLPHNDHTGKVDRRAVEALFTDSPRMAEEGR